MSEAGKVTSSHLSRAALIYVRQSTLAQLERNTESTARQYDLVNRARQLGWPREAIRVIDGDQGISGSVTGQRAGFEGLVAEVALGQVGIILALEASRLARDNAAWYRLLDLAGVCDTLVADADGVYHPALFNDRLVLGMKGIMAEAELHVLRARLEGGIKNKAARGELRRGLPVGLVWGETSGEIRFHPDEAVTGVIAAVFERFAVCGSVRATWLWLRGQGLRWPLQRVAYLRPGGGLPEITWVEPTYHAVHTTLSHPAYAGAYVYGRTRKERYLDASGVLRLRSRRLPRDRWEVLIPDHHPGFIDWDTYLANQARIGTNIRPQARQPGTGAVREGCALLQGLATCGACGRKLAIFYTGPAKCVPNYYCQGSAELVNGRGARHMSAGGQAIDAAVADAFLAALAPAALQACLAAARQLEDGHDTALAQWRRQVEQARYHASKAERRYRAVDRDNPNPHATLVLRWKGGAISELTVPLRRRQPKIRTSEDTISLIRRLAAHYPDAQIAGILNRQHRTTARGLSFTANRVASLRTHWHIPCHQPSCDAPAEGDLLNVTQAARQLGIAPSTLLRWLDDGFVAGEQITPGAPWQIRLTAQLRGMLTDTTPDGWVPLAYATQALGVSRQTVLQRVKRGELRAVLTRAGRRKGLRIELPAPQDGLF